MKTTLTACLFALALTAPALAQNSPPQNRPPTPNMDTGRSDQRAPHSAVVSEKADQILVRDVIGQPLYARSGGDRLGTIKDALLHRDSNTLDVLIVDTGGGEKALRTIAWSDVDATDRKHLTADLDPADLKSTSANRKNGKSFEERAKQGDEYVSVADRLLGKKVTSPDGKTVGSIDDLVVDMKTAKIVAALIDTPTGLAMGANDTPRAVPWSAAQLPSDKNAPIALTLSREQLAKEPGFTTKGPEAPGTQGSYPTPSEGTSSGQTGSSPTLDLGGKSIMPPPAGRRTQ
jgi:sporulation protein YlmC with PRC-barrel domain